MMGGVILEQREYDEEGAGGMSCAWQVYQSSFVVIVLYMNAGGRSTLIKWGLASMFGICSEWVSSFLTAHEHHNVGYAVPYY